MSKSLIQEILDYKQNEISLSRQTALITGASAGIGLACAVALAKEGCNLILVARREEKLDQLKKELRKSFPKIRVDVFPIDVCSPQAVTELKTYNALDVDIFINNAGLARSKDFTYDIKEEDLDEMVDTNIKAAFKFSSAVAKIMVKKKSGHIIHLGSIAGHHPYEGGSVYCATKSALRAFHQSMRQELYDKNVRVSLISPGLVATEFSLVRFKGDKKKAAQVYEGVECLQAADIARVIVNTLKAPKHVNLDEVIVMPTVQVAGNFKVHKK